MTGLEIGLILAIIVVVAVLALCLHRWRGEEPPEVNAHVGGSGGRNRFMGGGMF
jgi:hypothetical protein